MRFQAYSVHVQLYNFKEILGTINNVNCSIYSKENQSYRIVLSSLASFLMKPLTWAFFALVCKLVKDWSSTGMLG